eukprot:CAMPEP_0175773032 /NCGR_PEP_ID=MMETSP0097-20121207/72872_1 /TAXON_ID=311494 /ORGANISM="Alexandrium monilatum, Strain CCMP3105" /LENGTH=109 /DNA_ID=CAMNT_0017083437 /DNA_START=206 /DNA_END=531 /DNA_ORIENTATION=+
MPEARWMLLHSGGQTRSFKFAGRPETPFPPPARGQRRSQTLPSEGDAAGPQSENAPSNAPSPASMQADIHDVQNGTGLQRGPTSLIQWNSRYAGRGSLGEGGCQSTIRT